MALKVWLPLNGNLIQQGTANTTFSGTPAWKTYGKIGNAALNLQNRITCTTAALNGIQFFSVTFWVRIENNPDSTANWMDIIGFTDQTSSGSNGQFRFETGYGNTAYSGVHWHDNATNAIINGSYTYNTGTEFDKWHHIAVTISDTAVCSYYDGVLKSTLTANLNKGHLTGAWWLGEATTRGCIQDVRIYNHALSAAEVHKISQGLVLHYKFNSAYNESSSNLCTAVRPGTGANVTWGGHVTQWTNYDATNDPVPFNEGTKGEIVYGQNGSTNGGASRSICTIAASPSTAYTYSCYIKASDNLTYTHANFLYKYEYTAVSGGTKITEAGYFNNSRKELLSNGWYRIWGTFTTSNNTNCINISFYTYPNKNVTYWLGGWQIEQKDHVTPFMPPNTSRNNATIQDSSGYNHNGIITGNIQTPLNSARYSNCIYIPSGNIDYITTKEEIGNFSSGITMNIWFKSTCTSPGNSYHEIFNIATATQNFEFALHSSGYFRGGMVINGTRYVDNTAALGLMNGNWHMITMTYDGAVLRRYVDGIDRKDTTISGTLTSTSCKFLFGHYGNNTSYYAKEAYLSDARIYCTALSADDIKALYEVSAKVDNKQNFHSYEVYETNINLLSGIQWSTPFSSHTPSTSLFTNYNSNGEPQFTSNSTSAGTDYIEINPTGHTYEYDYTISVNAGNQFYIGFERYDANKTARSNNACVYTFSSKPSSDIVKQHYTGTINLSTDGTNPCKYIALRILNGWSGTNSGVTGTATIHNISLRQVGTKQQPKITKTGLCIGEELKEETNTKLHKNGIVETNEIIEF